MAPGAYYVEFVAPSGYTFSPQDVGGNDALDSDANPATGVTATTTLTSGETDGTWDAGLYQVGSITGQVREDQNANGNLADPDPAIPGVTVQLYTDPNGDGNPADGTLVSTKTTDASGNYSFTGLAPGGYVVVETNLAGYFSSGDKVAPNDDRIPVALPTGGSSTGNDFLDYRLATLGDRVWLDTNGNGIQDSGEPGLADVTVTLYDDGTGDQVGSSIVTPSSGAYSFSGLMPGSYKVCFTTPPAGYVFSPTGQGTAAIDSDAEVTAGGCSASFALASGETNNTLDAGLHQNASFKVTKTLLDTYNIVWPRQRVKFNIRIENTGDVPITVLPLRDTYDPIYLAYGFGAELADPLPNTVAAGTLDWSDLTVAAPYGFDQELQPHSFFDVVVVFTAIKDTTETTSGKTANTALVHDAFAGLQPVANQDSQASVQILNPTGVTLAGLTAAAEGDGVRVDWETASEQAIAGFNLLRRAEDGVFEAVTSDIIVAKTPGANQGASYTYLDSDLAPGVFTYRLEVVGLDGAIETIYTAPVTTRLVQPVGGPQHLWLPFVSR